MPASVAPMMDNANGAVPRTSPAEALYCGSAGRSALAGKALTDCGCTQVFNLDGFKDWVEAGLPVGPARG